MLRGGKHCLEAVPSYLDLVALEAQELQKSLQEV
jgi:hypothetical protein